MPYRRGFTLVEVAIATLILVVAALVVLMLLPASLQAQQQSRYRMMAAIHASNLIDSFYNAEIDLVGLKLQATVPNDSNNGLSKIHDVRDTMLGHELLQQAGMYDLERRTVNRLAGNYPVPLDIARRLDSPDNEIKRILDSGGYIYWSDGLGADPVGESYQSTDAKRNHNKLGSSNREDSRGVSHEADVRKMVWGIVTPPQQNLLPYSPGMVPHQELYPFPPQARAKPIERFYAGELQFGLEKDGDPITYNAGELYRDVVLSSPITVQRYRQVFLSNDFKAIIPASKNELGTHEKDLKAAYDQYCIYQYNNWTWYAHSEPTSKWAETQEHFYDLVNKHWLRIFHQLDSRPWPKNAPDSGSVVTGEVAQEVEVERTRIVTDANGDVVRGDGGIPVTETYKVKRTETFGQDADGNVVETTGGDKQLEGDNLVSWRGYPHPAMGLPYSNMRGTDIIEEDAAAVVDDLANQIRIGLPSLERRIMYRSAALALWAKAMYGKDITRPEDPTKLYLQEVTNWGQTDDASSHTVGAAPSTASGKDYLAVNENPFFGFKNLKDVSNSLGEITADLHPTQVLALSYLAHASMMVTGYKQPFVHSNNTLVGMDDRVLVPDALHPDFASHYETLPYRAVEATNLLDENGLPVTKEIEVVKTDGSLASLTVQSDGRIDLSGITNLDPRYVGPNSGQVMDIDGSPNTSPAVIDQGRNIYLWNPYHHDIMDDTLVDPHEEAGALTTGNKLTHQVYRNAAGTDGRPVMYRRMTGGIINPAPGPYADRGMIDLAGDRTSQYTDNRKWLLDVEWTTVPDPSDPTSGVTVDFPKYRLIRKLDRSDGDADDTDSRVARNVHEACLRLAMHYVSHHPYDLTVPKPANRQAFIDRGLYAFDLFDATGRARRPQQMTSSEQVSGTYAITSPADGVAVRFAPGVQHANPFPIDHWHDYRPDNNVGMRVTDPYPPTTTGERFDFGEVRNDLNMNHQAWTNYQAKPWGQQEHFTSFVNLLHGHDKTAVNHPAPARPERFLATKRFDAQDRCRQLVYWQVNWQQYEDFEAVPSTPVDLSVLDRKPGTKSYTFTYGGNLRYKSGKLEFYWPDSDLSAGDVLQLNNPAEDWSEDYVIQQTGIWSKLSDDDIAEAAGWSDMEIQVVAMGPGDQPGNQDWLRFGNPEWDFTWLDPERTATRRIYDPERVSTNDGDGSGASFLHFASDHTALPLNTVSKSGGSLMGRQSLEMIATSALGSFGADRDGNGRYTVGTIPPSTRMQASEISRFTFYDPITWLSLGR